MTVDRKVALVTGAASGMGRATALAYLARGWNVVAADIAQEQRGRIPGLASLGTGAGEAGSALETVAADVAIPDDVARMVDRAGERFGRLDVLVNSAAILDRMLIVDELPLELWQRVMAVNVTGTFLACQRAIPVMIARGGGVIVNISSSAGVRGGRGGAAYTTSKHAIIGLSRNIGVTYRDQGIRCVTIVPTAMGHGFGTGDEGPRGHAVDTNAKTRGTWPERRGTPEDIAQLVLFLASDEARHINASEIYADGGALGF